MFLYLDSSALVKRYVDEPHSEAVAHLMDETLAIGTSAISRVEIGAALARAARGNRLDAEGARGSPGAVRRRLAGTLARCPLRTGSSLAPRDSPGSTGYGHTMPYSSLPPSYARKRSRNSTRASCSHASTMS